MAAIILRERVRFVRIAAVLLGFVGVVIIVFPRLSVGIGTTEALGVGLTLAFLVAVVFGLTVVKVTRGELNERFDHVVRPQMEIAE